MIQNRSQISNYNRIGLQERFKQTDQALEDVPTWPDVIMYYLFTHFIFSMIDMYS